jgi:hypothetical protein
MATDTANSLEGDQALQRNKHSHWKIFQTIERLEASPVSADYSPEILAQVLAILRNWAQAWSGVAAYQSFLNKKSLHHEIEECLPALHHLNEWRKVVSHVDRFVAMDVCGGKGCLAMLVQYVAAHYWNKDGSGRPILDHVILLEKAKCDEIDWYHLLHPPDDDLIPLVIWEDCNLHETDALWTRIRVSVSYPIAATGIHLCKMLSPSMVSLVNLLGPDKCVYVCLAPCCMPRAVTKTAQRNILGKARNNKTADPTNAAVERQPSYVHVAVFETLVEREDRMLRIQRRDAARRRKGRLSNLVVSSNSIHKEDTGGKTLAVDGCFCCRSTSHQMQFCPIIGAMSAIERENVLQSARPSMTLTPCWNCGMAGHVQAECGNPRVETVVKNGDHVRSLIEPPQTLLNVTNILDSADPMRVYCDLLVGSIHCTLKRNEIPWSRMVWETVLVNAKAENQPTANWNSGRKAMYLVAYARPDVLGHVLQTPE